MLFYFLSLRRVLMPVSPAIPYEQDPYSCGGGLYMNPAPVASRAQSYACTASGNEHLASILYVRAASLQVAPSATADGPGHPRRESQSSADGPGSLPRQGLLDRLSILDLTFRKVCNSDSLRISSLLEIYMQYIQSYMFTSCFAFC